MLPLKDKEKYEDVVKANVSANEDKALRSQVNDFIQKMKENLMAVRKDGSGVAHYDTEKDAVYMPKQENFEHYSDYVQEMLRQVVSATGHQQRLAREGMVMKNGIAPSEDAVKQEKLVVELASGIKMMEMGMPAKISKENMGLVDYWNRELKENPCLIDAIAVSYTHLVYDLTDDELKALTNNSVKQVSVAKRLEILNNVIKDDFADKITMDMLNSKERIQISLRPEVQQELDGKMRLQSTVEPLQVQQEPMNNKIGIVDGQDLDESKGWFREGKHGREVTVGEIRVEPAEQEGKYRMTAIINGERVSHEITQKQYDKFMAVDDYHRMKLFSKIFGEVDMKDRTSLGTKIGAALLAGLGVAAEVGSELHRPHGAPVVIVDHHHGAVPAPPRPYFKPGVDTPMDVAARNFEAAMNQEVLHPHMGKGL